MLSLHRVTPDAQSSDEREPRVESNDLTAHESAEADSRFVEIGAQIVMLSE
jgi:hypothetical protein